MDDVLSAAINEIPMPQSVGDEVPRFGVLTLADRIFVYRAVSALCGAGVPLRDAFASVADVMRDPVSHEKEAGRIRHHASKAVDALAAVPPDRVGVTLGAILEDRVGFVIDDVERCMLSLDHRTVGPRDLAAVFRSCLDFLLAVQSTAKGARR